MKIVNRCQSKFAWHLKLTREHCGDFLCYCELFSSPDRYIQYDTVVGLKVGCRYPTLRHKQNTHSLCVCSRGSWPKLWKVIFSYNLKETMVYYNVVFFFVLVVLFFSDNLLQWLRLHCTHQCRSWEWGYSKKSHEAKNRCSETIKQDEGSTLTCCTCHICAQSQFTVLVFLHVLTFGLYIPTKNFRL